MNTILIERIDIMTAREGQQLWKPTDTEKQTANITKFMNHINKKENKNLQYYQDIWNWSVNHLEDYWRYIWEYFNVKYSVDDEKVMEGSSMIETKWFTEIGRASCRERVESWVSEEGLDVRECVMCVESRIVARR